MPNQPCTTINKTTRPPSSPHIINLARQLADILFSSADSRALKLRELELRKYGQSLTPGSYPRLIYIQHFPEFVRDSDFGLITLIQQIK